MCNRNTGTVLQSVNNNSGNFTVMEASHPPFLSMLYIAAWIMTGFANQAFSYAN